MNATATDVKPKATEQVRADARQRVIANARKPAKRSSPKVPKAHPPKVPVLDSATISTPLVPAFSQPTQAKFGLAVQALKAKGRSLNQRLLICHFYLKSDPALSAIDPELLLKELNAQNR